MSIRSHAKNNFSGCTCQFCRFCDCQVCRIYRKCADDPPNNRADNRPVFIGECSYCPYHIKYACNNTRQNKHCFLCAHYKGVKCFTICKIVHPVQNSLKCHQCGILERLPHLPEGFRHGFKFCISFIGGIEHSIFNNFRCNNTFRSQFFNIACVNALYFLQVPLNILNNNRSVIHDCI